MIIVFILFCVACLGFYFNWVNAQREFWTNAYLEQRQEVCRPHKWSYRPADGKLQCARCSFVAGILIDKDSE